MAGLVVVIFLGGLLLTGIISLVVYTYVYNRRIESKLRKGDNSGVQWPAPKNIVLVVLIIVLVIFSISNIMSVNNGSVTHVDVNQYIAFNTYTSKDIKGTSAENYVDAFEKGELIGYTKEEKTENNFHYMYFISETEYDILHPSFILFVEYVGEENYECYMDTGKAYLDEGNAFTSAGGGEMSKYYLVVGNIDFDSGCGFKYELGLYEDESKMEKEFDSDYLSESSERVSIVIEKHSRLEY